MEHIGHGVMPDERDLKAWQTGFPQKHGAPANWSAAGLDPGCS